MRLELPPFEPVTLKELRTLYTRSQDKDIRRLTLEIMRYRQILGDIDGLHKSIQLAWDRHAGGHLICLYHLQCMMNTERMRTATCNC
jgi:hypothetical protein